MNRQRIAIVIPVFNTQASLDRILSEIPADLQDGVIVVDDGSTPPIRATGVRLKRHDKNRGYGGAQKTGYETALAAGAERIILLHGDGQYATADVLGLSVPLAACDAAIGSRFLNMGSHHIPTWRRWGNRVLTTMANIRFGTQVSELHSGARAFTAQTLRSVDFHRFSDDYIFDHQMLATLLNRGATIGERKVRCAYNDEVQSIQILPAVRYAIGVIHTIVRPPSN
jgi:glycosyltransferase involved in cell wall biosynthesis